MMPMRSLSLAALCMSVAVFVSCGGSSDNSGNTTTKGSAYVTTPSINGVVAFRVDSSASFTPVIGSPFAAGSSPSSILIHPNNKFIYVANRGSNNVSLFIPDTRTGVLTEIMPRTPTGIDPEAMVMDANGGFIYVVNEATNSISVFSVNSSSGALTEIAGSPFATPLQPTALALSRAGNLLFVTHPNLAAVSVYAVTSGALQQVAGSPFLVNGSGPAAVITGASDHFLYVANSNSANISILSINATTGALTETSGSPLAAGTAPIAFVTNSTASFLYVMNLQSNNVSAFGADANTGSLTALTGSPFAAGTAPVSGLVDSSGTTLFVVNQGSSNISHFGIKTDGTLNTSVASNTLGSAPSAMVLTK